MYIAKFLNVCIRTRSLSRPSCIPYLRMYFGNDMCERASVKKKKTRKFRGKKSRLTLSLLNSELSSHDEQTRHRSSSFTTIFSWDRMKIREPVKELKAEFEIVIESPFISLRIRDREGSIDPMSKDPISIAIEGHEEKRETY